VVDGNGSSYGKQWEAITPVADEIGCWAEALRNWVPKADRDAEACKGFTKII
jgi:hypothetical protein